MGEGGGAGNGQSRVEKMRCLMYRNVQDGLRSKVRLNNAQNSHKTTSNNKQMSLANNKCFMRIPHTLHYMLYFSHSTLHLYFSKFPQDTTASLTSESDFDERSNLKSKQKHFPSQLNS